MQGEMTLAERETRVQLSRSKAYYFSRLISDQQLESMPKMLLSVLMWKGLGLDG